MPSQELPRPDETLPAEVDVLVVGAGQAGLGVAYWLTRSPGLRVLVVDRAPVGQSWLDRWDSLVLFTPRRFSGLPGLRFPRGSTRCPTRTEMAAYLRATGIGASVGVGRIGAIIGQVLLAETAAAFSLTSMFVLLGVFWLIGAAAGGLWWVRGVEARGVALEDLAVRRPPAREPV